MKLYYVYIMSNKYNSVLYVGMTNDLSRRVGEHRNHRNPFSFTARYQVHKLVYYETTANVKSAIEREKQIKSWSRDRKVELIEKYNPTWEALLPEPEY